MIPALVCTIAKVRNITSDSFFDLISSVEERFRKGPSAPPRNEGQSPSSWVQTISDEASERKRERDDAPSEASKFGRVDGGGSSSGGGLSRAFVAHLQDVKVSDQYLQQRDGLLEYNSHLSVGEASYSQHGMLELILTGVPPIENWVEQEITDLSTGLKAVELVPPKKYAKAMKPLPLFHMYLSGKLDPLVCTPELEFIVPVLNERTLAKLLALVVVRIYYPSGEVPSCLVNLELTDLAKAFMNKAWKGCLDFPNQLDLMVSCVFNATAPMKNQSLYGDMLQLMRCSEAASACLKLFGFTDEKLSFSHSFQVIFGVSMLHGGNTSQSRAIFEQKASQYMLSVIEEACDRYNLVRHGNTPKTPLVTAFVQKGARSENTLKEWLQNADRAKVEVRAASSQGKATGTTATPCTAMALNMGPGQAQTMRQAIQSAQVASSSVDTQQLASMSSDLGSSHFQFLKLSTFGLTNAELSLKAPGNHKNQGIYDLQAVRTAYNTLAGRPVGAVVCPAYALAGNRSQHFDGKRACLFGCSAIVHEHEGEWQSVAHPA
jgi:hypothetical protein